MQKCERCNINDARVRVNTVTNGRREQHFYCKDCAQELFGQMNAEVSGGGDFGSMFSPFINNGGGFNMNGMNGAAMGAGRPNGTATAQREPNKHSKTPTIDQFGRDLTQDARDGKLDPASGRDREIRRVLTVLGRRQKNNPVLIGEPGV
ncbi:MAG: ATP-dependent Clp protease ATP-binding subunit, partial [Ktedonobacterales bacterium]